jgi:HSP20 family protein
MSVVTYRPRRVATPSLFNDDFVRTFFAPDALDTRRSTNFVPAVNVKETETAYTLQFAVPGRKKEDLKVNVERNVLTVSYKSENTQENTTEAQNVKTHVREFMQKSFSRSFQLPETVNVEGIHGDYTDGILTVTLPKTEVTPAHTREISLA